MASHSPALLANHSRSLLLRLAAGTGFNRARSFFKPILGNFDYSKRGGSVRPNLEGEKIKTGRLKIKNQKPELEG